MSTFSDTSLPDRQGAEPGADKLPGGPPPADEDSKFGLYLILAIFIAGCVLIAMKLFGFMD